MIKLIIVLLLIVETALALDELPKDLIVNSEVYIVTLYNSDEFTGTIAEYIFSEEDGEGIKLNTELGKAPIYAYQIRSIKTQKQYYRHNHRIFLQPTAYPISDNHYVGVFELLYFNVGVGISDYFSFTAGRSLIPGIYSDQQVTSYNAKATLLNMKWEEAPGGMAFALAGNLAYLNDDNQYLHFMAITTFDLKKASFSASIFYKAGGKDFNDIKIRDELIETKYANGAIGVGLGLDNRLENWKNIHFIGEIWNSNITQPSNTGIFLGLRYANRKISTDFGFALFTSVTAAPFASFVWTPF